MLRRDWSPKPNAETYQDLVFKKWWANATAKTDAKGAFTVRGFLGDYEVVASVGGKTKTLRVNLPRSGTRVECVLE